jgi:hypothetical protein
MLFRAKEIVKVSVVLSNDIVVQAGKATTEYRLDTYEAGATTRSEKGSTCLVLVRPCTFGRFHEVDGHGHYMYKRLLGRFAASHPLPLDVNVNMKCSCGADVEH